MTGNYYGFPGTLFIPVIMNLVVVYYSSSDCVMGTLSSHEIILELGFTKILPKECNLGIICKSIANAEKMKWNL